jgi:hypothetical protein
LIKAIYFLLVFSNILKERACIDCGRDISYYGSRAIRCSKCQKEERKRQKREYIKEYQPDFDKGLIIYRIGNSFLKFVLQPWYNIEELKEKPNFIWQKYKTELEINEYVDIVMSLVSHMFEYYYSFVKNNVIFNCTEIGKNLGIDERIIAHISKHRNLQKVYDALSAETTSKYGIETDSFFPPQFVDVRNAIAHMDYYYERINSKGNFKIFLNKEKTMEIKFDDLIKLIHRIVPLINTIKIIPYYFAHPDSTLPLK